MPSNTMGVVPGQAGAVEASFNGGAYLAQELRIGVR
jgi:hypothetical protein